MEIVNYFVGLTFAWTVLGLFFILPVWRIVESYIMNLVEYATDGEVYVRSPFAKFYDAYLRLSSNDKYRTSWVYNNDYETYYWLPMALYSGISVIIFVIYGIETYAKTAVPVDWIDIITTAMFSAWFRVGNFLSPLLIVAVVVIGSVVGVRKAFKFKHRVEKKLEI